jgi:hypothetical protein
MVGGGRPNARKGVWLGGGLGGMATPPRTQQWRECQRAHDAAQHAAAAR